MSEEITPDAPAPEQDAIAAEQAVEAVQIATVEAQVAAVTEATPVVQQTPPNEASAEEPVEVAPQNTIEEAAAKLLAIVDEGHKLGDRTLDAARDELRAILGA